MQILEIIASKSNMIDRDPEEAVLRPKLLKNAADLEQNFFFFFCVKTACH
jgi:hypothetical protein